MNDRWDKFWDLQEFRGFYTNKNPPDSEVYLNSLVARQDGAEFLAEEVQLAWRNFLVANKRLIIGNEWGSIDEAQLKPDLH